ncbi:hypothetical protein BCR35DRAFT_331715 [Leucosporidium creatinivorum]|uniref:Uncharacterized protein n=1 Tax=Leucosporidium creatinivorum TaxID=106004 RepID=A0A1Y2FDB9_9BASI|nr:hypothetical protein BCR35DRAFT_331715 [Leucosporidium creatinivorum]
MSAAQIFYAVRAAAPTSNPFVAIAYTLHGSFYPNMSTFFMRSISVLHGLYALQTVLLLAALAVRYRRTPGDVWVFKSVSTPRGTYFVPHFAVAWQLSTLGFLIILQPYLVMTTEHAYGNDWRGYLGGRTMGFLPAWLSTWLALWSLTVAVCLPRATGRRQTGLSFFSSPTFINTHFIGGVILCCTSIIAPSILCARLYDQAVDAYRVSRTMLLGAAPGFANMTSAEVDSALAKAVPIVDRMLEKADQLELSFKASWWM